MKKIILIICFFMFPINVFAYSDKLIVGGDSLGIEVKNDGLLVTGFYKIDSLYNKGTPEIKIGDYIIKADNKSIDSISDLTNEINNLLDKRFINLTIRRNNKNINIKLPLIKDEDKYKTGLYVKDSIKGIGTLTFIEPQTNIYGALGHEIIESDSNSVVEIKSGLITSSYITSIDKSRSGYAGSKIANINNNELGTIVANTKSGIFGKYYQSSLNNLVEVSNNPHEGKASILTVLDNDKVMTYDINIISINEKSLTKNFIIEIVDNNLIEKTGGVVQGMSGSPIIQDEKIIGALTHVIVDNPIRGYGIKIQNMLNEIDKLSF